MKSVVADEISSATTDFARKNRGLASSRRSGPAEAGQGPSQADNTMCGTDNTEACGQPRSRVICCDGSDMDTFRYSELVAQGMEEPAIRKSVRNGELTRVRHGGFVSGTVPDTPEQRHLALLETTRSLLKDDTVISYGTAAILWGLPVPPSQLDRIHVTRNRNAGGTIERWAHTHCQPLADLDVVEHNGILTTSLARTAVDVSRRLPRDAALAVMDAAWRQAGTPDALAEQVSAASHKKGVATARWALAHANPLAESPGESRSRYWMIAAGLPLPLLQFEVQDASGRVLGRADFAWPDHRVLGEFDGRIKYDRLVPDGGTAADIVMKEKVRENLFRAEGWWVYRWIWDNLRDGRAFARGLARFLDQRPTFRG
ncbi:hypothetical protein [Brooklawnia cerclae]|uniref:hypothetical protein n=1 Tax=Brooklawnia cerclae TaxID=349934 RepID=UPI0035E81528